MPVNNKRYYDACNVQALDRCPQRLSAALPGASRQPAKHWRSRRHFRGEVSSSARDDHSSPRSAVKESSQQPGLRQSSSHRCCKLAPCPHDVAPGLVRLCKCHFNCHKHVCCNVRAPTSLSTSNGSGPSPPSPEDDDSLDNSALKVSAEGQYCALRHFVNRLCCIVVCLRT